MSLLLSLALACTQPHVPGELPRTGEVLETVNGKAVTQDMMDALLETMPDEYRAQLEEQGQMGVVQEQLVTQDMLYQEAMNRGLHNDAVVKNMIAVAEREALIEALLRQVAEEKTTDEALKKYYDEHAVQFRKSEVNLAQIVVDSEEEAAALKAGVEAGADFATLASEKSLDPMTKAKGGELGWIDARQLPPNISMAAEGTLLEPMNQGGKWYVIKIAGKRDEVTPFEDVKDQIKSQVQKESVTTYVDELRASMTSGEGEATVTPPVPGAPAAPTAPTAPTAPAAPTPAH